MTATLPIGPSTTGGPPRIRVDARPGAVYCYDVLDHNTSQVVPGDYTGQSRSPARRDKEHRGLIPERDGVVREKPWADRIVGAQRILEQGVWTDAELDERELAWMHHLGSRLNDKDNRHNPNRIPICVQRQQRDARDAARGLPARDWSRPTPRVVNPAVVPVHAGPSLWSRFWGSRPGRWLTRKLIRTAKTVGVLAAVWVVCVGALWLAAHQMQQPAALADLAGGGVVGTAAAVAGWWRWLRPRRRGRSRQYRTRRGRR